MHPINPGKETDTQVALSCSVDLYTLMICCSRMAALGSRKKIQVSGVQGVTGGRGLPPDRKRRASPVRDGMSKNDVVVVQLAPAPGGRLEVGAFDDEVCGRAVFLHTPHHGLEFPRVVLGNGVGLHHHHLQQIVVVASPRNGVVHYVVPEKVPDSTAQHCALGVPHLLPGAPQPQHIDAVHRVEPRVVHLLLAVVLLARRQRGRSKARNEQRNQQNPRSSFHVSLRRCLFVAQTTTHPLEASSEHCCWLRLERRGPFPAPASTAG